MKLFIDKEAKPKKSYADKISNLYNASIDSVNFKNTAEAVAQVNSWANSVTRGHIQHLLTEGKLIFYFHLTYWFRSSF